MAWAPTCAAARRTTRTILPPSPAPSASALPDQVEDGTAALLPLAAWCFPGVRVGEVICAALLVPAHPGASTPGQGALSITSLCWCVMFLEWWLCVPACCGEDVQRLCKAAPSWEYNPSTSLSLPSPSLLLSLHQGYNLAHVSL